VLSSAVNPKADHWRTEETTKPKWIAIMSISAQHRFSALDLFSSALFCVWLSMASLLASFDLIF
jgi:hypothetical protein